MSKYNLKGDKVFSTLRTNINKNYSKQLSEINYELLVVQQRSILLCLCTCWTRIESLVLMGFVWGFLILPHSQQKLFWHF